VFEVSLWLINYRFLSFALCPASVCPQRMAEMTSIIVSSLIKCYIYAIHVDRYYFQVPMPMFCKKKEQFFSCFDIFAVAPKGCPYKRMESRS